MRSLTICNTSRIFGAPNEFDEPKLEWESNAIAGSIPKRWISSAAINVISASSSAVGLVFTWVSVKNTFPVGNTRLFNAAATLTPSFNPIISLIDAKCLP